MAKPKNPTLAQTVTTTKARRTSKKYQFDVCLSFAGEDRRYVERVANELREMGVGYYRIGQGHLEGRWATSDQHASGAISFSHASHPGRAGPRRFRRRIVIIGRSIHTGLRASFFLATACSSRIRSSILLI